MLLPKLFNILSFSPGRGEETLFNSLLAKFSK